MLAWFSGVRGRSRFERERKAKKTANDLGRLRIRLDWYGLRRTWQSSCLDKQILAIWLKNLMKCNSIKVRQKDLNVLTGPCDLQGFWARVKKISHCRLFTETLPLEMFWLEKMKLVKWLTLEWQEMCKNKIFMKKRQRFVLYWKLTYSTGLARNPLPLLPGGKYVKFCRLFRCFLGFML